MSDTSSLKIEVVSVGIKEASNQLSGLGTSARNAETRVTKLTDSITKLMGVQRTATAAAQQYAAAIQNTYNNIVGGTGATATLASATTQLGQAMILLAQSINNVNVRSNQARQSMFQFTASMRDAHAAARGFAGSLGALWMTYGNLVPLAAGLALGASFKAIVTIGKDVEHTLEGIRVRGVESVESVNALRESVLSLGQGVYGPREVAKAFDVLILAGLNAQQALAGIKDALNLATVGGTTIEKAAEVLVQVGTALGYDAAAYSRISDVIAMTAAASMSSVESVSESFKAGSVVGKLYGATLTDIGTQFAALSNLGIKGSAAGTAVRNFYAVLSSGSDKVTSALKKVGLTLKDLQDSQGDFIPFVDLMRKLSDAMNGVGVSTKALSEAAQKQAIAALTNERGNKVMVEGLSLVRKAGIETASALGDLNKKIEESYGFTAAGAAAMALTVESQFKSVKNTLETQFIKAFQDIQPQLSVISTRLKQAFNSPEFEKGVQNVAIILGDLARVVVENIDKITLLIEAIIGFKVVSTVYSTLIGLVESFTALSTAMKASRAAAIGLWTALGAGTLILGALAAAYMWYKSKKEEANATTNASITYLEDYNGKMDEELTRLTRQLDLMRQNKTATEAQTQALREQQLQMVEMQGQKAIDAAQKDFDMAKSGMSSRAIAQYEKAKANGWGRVQLDEGGVNKLLELERKQYQVALDVNKQRGQAVIKTQQLAEVSKQLAAEAERQSKAQRANDKAGSADFASDDPSAVRDAWRANLEGIQSEINRAKREFQRTEFELQQQEKAGNISKLEMIEKIGQAEADLYRKEIAGYNAKIATAGTMENKLALQAQLSDKLAAAEENLANVQLRAEQQTAVAIADLEKQITQNKIAELETRGRYVEAAQLKYQDSFAKEIEAYTRMADELKNKQLTAEFLNDAKGAEEFARQLAIVSAYLESVNTKGAAFKHSAAFKEADERFKASMAEVDAQMAEIDKKLANKGSWFDRFFAQDDLDNIIKNRLPTLKKELEDLQKVIQDGSATEAERKKYNEDLENYNKLLRQQGRSYKEFMETVIVAEGREAFEALTSSVAGAWSNYIQKLKASFKKMIIDWLYEQLAKPFVISIVGQFAGAMGMPSIASAAQSMLGGSGSAGGASGLIGAAQQAGSLYSMLSSANPSGMLAQQIQSGYNWLTGSGGTVAQGPIQVSGTAQTLGTVGAYVGGAMLGRTIGSAISQGFETSVVGGQAAVNIGTAIGAYVGGPIGAIVGGALGGVFNRAFGHGPTEVRAQGIRGSVNTNGLFGEMYQKKHQDGGWFTSDNDWTDTSAVDKTIATQFANGFNALKATSEAFAESIGVSTASLAGYSKQFDIQLTNDAQANQQAITDFFTAMGDDMALKLVPNLMQFSKTGETASAVLQRLSEDFNATNAMAQMLGKTAVEVFGSMDMASAQAREYLIQLAGGSSNLTSKVSAYSQEFLSDAEKLVPVQKAVKDAMTAIGYGGVTTKAQFKGIVDSLDLTTEYGARLFNQLMDLAPAFAQVANAAQAATDAALEQAKANVETARSNLTAAYNKESQAIKETQSKFSDFAKSLKAFQSSLMLGSLSPATLSQRYAQAKADYESTLTRAMTGDQDAISKFQNVANEFLSLSREFNASGVGYTADFNSVSTSTAALAQYASTQVDVATASLEALNKQVEGLITINDSVLTVAQAIIELQNAMAAVGAVNTPSTVTLPTSVPTGTFSAPQTSLGGLAGTALGLVLGALDGSHANGLDYVPFDGYRAELHKGERVLTANENKEYQLNLSNYGRGANEALVKEIKALREEVKQLRAEQAEQAERQIIAEYDANDRAADKVAGSVGDAVSKTSWKERAKPNLV